MSPHVTVFGCDGCDSIPIWKQRWRCKECSNFDLCEACYGELEAVDMPPEHSKEHPMVAVEVFCTEWHKIQSSFSKPVSPQWSYQVHGDEPMAGFVWGKRKPSADLYNASLMSSVEYETVKQISPMLNEDHIPNPERNIRLMNKSLSFKQASETAPAPRTFERKHKIFLSHAETEKDFVEQLYVDLSRVHLFGVFFDKEDDSLPKGEVFSQRIFDAAEHYQLAIVVLSGDYFIRKWPMLELATFVEAQKRRTELKILPVFYKLSVQEFKQCQESYVKFWDQLPRSSVAKGDIQRWREALKVISRTNGIEFNKRMGEVAFREKIVEIVYKRVKPDLLWDDSHVQGKARMHGMIQEKIQVSKDATGGVQSNCTSFMEVYGMGGSGKTTMCKVLCNEMTQPYLGKVCHIEFGTMDMLQLRKKLLQSINFLDSSVLSIIDEGQALNLLKHHIPKQKMCLIIDNVSDDQASIQEARTLLNLSFKEGSLLLVTSRSYIILEKLKIKWKGMMRIPALTTDEARALFSHHASCDSSSLSADHRRAMEEFVERCNFKVEGMVSREYHPLALKVLGTRAGPDPEDWENIKIDFKYYEKENKHHIFSILRSSYDALIPQYQRMFLDMARSKSNFLRGLGGYGIGWQMRCLYGERDQRFIIDLVKVLRAKSLVESYDENFGTIFIHDLYCEFAQMEVEKKTLQHCPRCCFTRASSGQHSFDEGRLRIQNQHVPHITKDILSCTVCSKAELLTVEGCANLKSIDVPDMHNLKMFVVIGGCPQLTRVNLEGAASLQCLL